MCELENERWMSKTVGREYGWVDSRRKRVRTRYKGLKNEEKRLKTRKKVKNARKFVNEDEEGWCGLRISKERLKGMCVRWRRVKASEKG